ncbi:MAG: STAS domain-containing protein [Myxococcota bacterium]|nr:STAS domain-containing protein [Myxococcota bacterium]
MLNIEQKQHAHVTVIALSGQLDAITASEFKPLIETLFNTGVIRIVFDLANLDLIDSSGVGAIVSVFKRSRSFGGDTKVANLANQPAEIFKILSLNKAIETFDSTEVAVNSFDAVLSLR